MSDDENNEADDQPAEDYAAAPLKDLQEGSSAPSNNTAQAMDDQDINLDVILDVPITISVEIGRTQVPIRDLLRYSQGSVVELDRLVSEPLDVLVNNTLIAHGEVVVVDDQFGIRLTDVISPSERVKKLK
ncbi:MAG: flagellar motor switch protein FliN [Gammaproteobacteria bacterium]|nr:flagellar motor switch protein FliN [Gammaproteobacteria bacterium]MBQ0839543.1 flagellar motor switch protein FliN [Gammaproteobacteria bacterium]